MKPNTSEENETGGNRSPSAGSQPSFFEDTPDDEDADDDLRQDDLRGMMLQNFPQSITPTMARIGAPFSHTATTDTNARFAPPRMLSSSRTNRWPASTRTEEEIRAMIISILQEASDLVVDDTDFGPDPLTRRLHTTGGTSSSQDPAQP
jgi:hypothetical protein